ncbi:hypothetical protein NHQ30_002515 [Ciborinia camelliae]|nr:hypothetical protein NHQ30_002515 [Ciborinia camelliae]
MGASLFLPICTISTSHPSNSRQCTNIINRKIFIVALAIAAPLSIALPLAEQEPESAKSTPTTTNKASEHHNIEAEPTWLSIPIIDPTKLFPIPFSTVISEPATTKGGEQDRPTRKPTPVVTTKGENQLAQSSRVTETNAPRRPKWGEGKKGERGVEEGSVEEGSVEEGSVEEGSVEEGSVEEGSVEEGSVEEGSVEEGSVEEGSVEEGSVEEGSVADKGKPTRKPDTASAPTATAKPTQNFTGKPDTEPVPTATAKSTQHFTGNPYTEPAPTATGKPTQGFPGNPDTPPTHTIKTEELGKPTEKPDGVNTTFATKYTGSEMTPSPMNANSFGPVETVGEGGRFGFSPFFCAITVLFGKRIEGLILIDTQGINRIHKVSL